MCNILIYITIFHLYLNVLYNSNTLVCSYIELKSNKKTICCSKFKCNDNLSKYGRSIIFSYES